MFPAGSARKVPKQVNWGHQLSVLGFEFGVQGLGLIVLRMFTIYGLLFTVYRSMFSLKIREG